MLPSTGVQGQPVEVHYVAVFNEQQKLIGDALHLPAPGIIQLQIVGDKMGYQFFMPKECPELEIVLSDPHIVGVALLDKEAQFLTGFSIPGRPELRKEGDVFTLRSRYMIMAPRKQPS